MLLTDQKKFVQLLVAMGEIYHRQVSPALTEIYWRALSNHTYAEVAAALEAHIRDPDTGQFMPKPADLLRVIEGNSESKCLQAWTKVEQAIRLIGPYRTVVFDDPIIHVVLTEMGGWIKMGKILEKELPYIAKEFQTRFKSYRYRPPTVYPRYLAGINEHRNILMGLSIEPPFLLGNKSKAQMILDQTSDALVVQDKIC